MNIKGKRDVGVDLLRILLALMVVSLHFIANETGHVAAEVNKPPFTYIIRFLGALCYPAVNTYILISGYYSYKQGKPFSAILLSLWKIWICLLFYSVVGYMVIIGIKHDEFEFTTILSRFFPLTRGVWWFMTNYFVLMLMSPLINTILNAYSRKDNVSILCFSILICSILPFFVKWNDVIGLSNGYSLVWFVVLYYTGALLQKSKEYVICKVLDGMKGKFVKLLGLYIFLSFSFYLINYVLNSISWTEDYSVAMYNSLVVYFQALILFLAFKCLNIGNEILSRVIVSLAGLSMAVYIFHCQEDISDFIWQYLKPGKYANDFKIIPVYLITVLSIYIISIIIEAIRRKLFSFLKIEKFITENRLMLVAKRYMNY